MLLAILCFILKKITSKLTLDTNPKGLLLKSAEIFSVYYPALLFTPNNDVSAGLQVLSKLFSLIFFGFFLNLLY